MSFLHPEFLYYMLPPLFILFGLLLTQKEAQESFFSDEVMSRLRVSANTLTLKARNALFFLMGFLIIIALAGPVINDGVVKVKAKSADIMIAFDISDSMLAQDVYPNRLKLAKQKALEFLKENPDDRVGVIAFAKNSYLVSPMSFDHSAVGFLLRQLQTDSITEKGTNILSLLESVDKNIKNENKKYLFILSDGGDNSDFSDEIAYAKEKNIVVFVLGVGTSKGAPVKLENGNFIKHNGEVMVSKLNDKISDLATSTGGVYIQNVNSNDDIKAMIKELKRKTEQKELKSEDIHKFIPLFYYPVGLALLILIIATSSMSKRERLQLPSAFLLFALLFSTQNAEAGLLDFMDLKEAKTAYEAGNYEKSEQLYKKHAQTSSNSQSYYNEANALYKQKKYEEAIKTYKKASFDDKKSEANNLANIGNAYVKKAKPKNLQKAVESYEKSLKLHEDKEVRENLEAVKKALEKQKQQDKKDSKNKKDSKDKKQDKDKKDSKKSDDDKKSDDKNKKNDEKENSEKQQDKDKKSDKEKENANKNNNKDNNETKPKKKKDDLKQLNKNEDNKTKEQKQQAEKHADNKDKMSEAEEVKWLKQLNTQQNTYMYMLNKANKEENSNEKPW